MPVAQTGAGGQPIVTPQAAWRRALAFWPLWPALLIGCACFGGGCRQNTAELLSSPSALDRAQGAVQLANSGDPNGVHRLVALLEDQDKAVRMYAIVALRRLTGEDLGYRYYAPEDERHQAVQRWRDALRDGHIRLRGGRPAEPPPQPAGVGRGTNRAPRPASRWSHRSRPVDRRHGDWTCAGGGEAAS